MVAENIAECIVLGLQSKSNELIHRILVLVTELSSSDDQTVVDHLLHGGVVSTMTATIPVLDDAQLSSLALQAAKALSAKVK